MGLCFLGVYSEWDYAFWGVYSEWDYAFWEFIVNGTMLSVDNGEQSEAAQLEAMGIYLPERPYEEENGEYYYPSFSHRLGWTSAFLLDLHRLYDAIEGRLSHFLPHWLSTG